MLFYVQAQPFARVTSITKFIEGKISARSPCSAAARRIEQRWSTSAACRT